MAEFYKKECPIEGSLRPVHKTNGVLDFSIPEKCDSCRFYFEGKCKKVTNRLLRLDYGFCGIDGPKNLVEHKMTTRKIPEKCKTCEYLKDNKLLKLACSKDSDIWGDMPRGLDY